MGFLAPLLLGMSALAIPIFLLYMLRLRRTEVSISSTFLWQQLIRDREANAPWQRLRPHPLMMLQLLILAALVLALARPFQEVETLATGRTVLLVDSSASMNTADMSDDRTRFEEAQQIALDEIDTLGSDDTMTIIRVAEIPEVLAADTRDRGVLREAIREAEPGTTVSDWQSAFALASAGGQGVDDLRVVVLSDGGIPSNLPEIPGDIIYKKIGRSDDNLAITALAVRALPNEPPQLFARIDNFGDTEAEFIFQLDLNDTFYSANRYTVSAQSSRDVFITDLPEDIDYVRATVSHSSNSPAEDYLDDDNVAHAVYHEGGGGRILIVTERNIFLERVFDSQPGVEVTVIPPGDDLPVTDYDLYVFDGVIPRSQLPRNDLLFVNPPESTAFFTLTGTSQETEIDSENNGVLPDDPRTLFVDFSAIDIREFRTLSNVEWADTLVQTADGDPLVLAGENNGQQVAIFTFALQDSNLPVNLTFPILIARLNEWFSSQRAINLLDSLPPGAPLVIRPTVDADRVRITRPDGEQIELGLDDTAQVIFADTLQTGLYDMEIRLDDRTVQRDYFAVNLFSPVESRIAPEDAINIQTSEGAVAIQSGEAETGRRELWNYLAGAAIIILLLEWIYYYYTLRRRRPRQTGFWGRRTTDRLPS